MLDGETNRGREGGSAATIRERGRRAGKEGKAANSRSAQYGGQEGRMEKLWKSESPSSLPWRWRWHQSGAAAQCHCNGGVGEAPLDEVDERARVGFRAGRENAGVGEESGRGCWSLDRRRRRGVGFWGVT